MNSLILKSLSLIIFLTLVSCTHMQSVHYVGKQIPVFEEYERNVSVWKEGGSVFFVKPISDYKATVATLKWDKDQKVFEQVNSEIIVSELGDYHFLNVWHAGLYTIVRLSGTMQGQIVIFEANQTKLEQDIKKGLIRIKENKDSKIFELQLSKQELDAYVERNLVELFELDSVSVISPVIPQKEKSNE